MYSLATLSQWQHGLSAGLESNYLTGLWIVGIALEKLTEDGGEKMWHSDSGCMSPSTVSCLELRGRLRFH